MEERPPDDQTPSGSDAAATSAGAEPAAGSGSFRRPAEYYELETDDDLARQRATKKRSWLPIGCGLAGCLALLVIFGGGVYLMRGGAAHLIGFIFSRVETQVDQFATPDVTAEQRATLRRELSRLQNHVRSDRIGLTETQPVLQLVSDSIRDQKLTSGEVDKLTVSMRTLSERAEKNSGSTDV